MLLESMISNPGQVKANFSCVISNDRDRTHSRRLILTTPRDSPLTVLEVITVGSRELYKPYAPGNNAFDAYQTGITFGVVGFEKVYGIEKGSFLDQLLLESLNEKYILEVREIAKTQSTDGETISMLREQQKMYSEFFGETVHLFRNFVIYNSPDGNQYTISFSNESAAASLATDVRYRQLLKYKETKVQPDQRKHWAKNQYIELAVYDASGNVVRYLELYDDFGTKGCWTISQLDANGIDTENYVHTDPAHVLEELAKIARAAGGVKMSPAIKPLVKDRTSAVA